MKVFLSPLAEKKLEILLEFLEYRWSLNARNEFLDTFLKSTQQISNHPKSCIESHEFEGLFKCVITKQTSYYYRILNDEIEIITIFDNRQNSQKVRAELKKFFS